MNRRTLLRAACATLVVVDVLLYYIFKHSLPLLHPAIETNPAIAAFCVVCLLNMIAIAGVGVRNWPKVQRTDLEEPNFTTARIPASEVLGVLQASFQVWDLVMALVIPELRKPEMLVHHTLVTYVAFAVFDQGVMHEPSLFFLGLSEIQGVPLTFVDFFTHIPPATFGLITEGGSSEAEAAANLAFDIAKYSLVVLFFYARIFLWAKHTWAFMTNARKALQLRDPKKESRSFKDKPETWGSRRRAGPHSYVILIFVLSLIVVTALQIFWGGLIIGEVVKLVT